MHLAQILADVLHGGPPAGGAMTTGDAGDAVLAALEGGPQAVALFDPEDRLVFSSAAFREGWAVPCPDGATFQSIMRRCHRHRIGALVETNDIEDWLAGVAKRRRGGPEARSFEVDLHDGRWFWVTERRLGTGFILLVGQDITGLKRSARVLQAAHEAALRASLTDALTELPNRRHALQLLEERMATGRPLLLALLDVDRFKRINDTYGHAVGDELLVALARRLRRLREAGCEVARLAGDEFAILSPPDEGCAALAARLERLVAGLAEPVEVGAHRVALGVSVGVARAPEDERTAEGLLVAADIAMYEAKSAGRSAVRLYDAGMGARRLEAAALRRDLAAAFRRGQFVPFYQPLVCLRTRQVRGYEVLARWRHPRLGVLTPDRFLPLLDSVDALGLLTEQLLGQAGRDLRAWPGPLRLSFNVSPRQLTPDGIVPLLRRLRDDRGIPLERLEMEVTEDALLRNHATARDVVAAVRALGLTIAIDDFGVGFSSLQHLREIPFDRIKVDRSFARRLDVDGNRVFLRALVQMAAALGLDVTVEGVEDQATAELVAALGCQVGQGYFFGRPCAVAEAHGAAVRVPGTRAP